MPARRTCLTILLILGMMLFLVPMAAADQVYHTAHVPLYAVSDAPLRSGFVENIHANGQQIFAHEIYQLNGAEPNTTYFVSLNFYGTSDCSGPLVQPVPSLPPTFQEISFATNAAGNGLAQSVISPDLVDQLGLHGVTLNVRWLVSTGAYSDQGGTVEYATGCEVPTLD